MRITKKQLKRIIKEETKAIVDEGWWPFGKKKEAEPESDVEPEPEVDERGAPLNEFPRVQEDEHWGFPGHWVQWLKGSFRKGEDGEYDKEALQRLWEWDRADWKWDNEKEGYVSTGFPGRAGFGSMWTALAPNKGETAKAAFKRWLQWNRKNKRDTERWEAEEEENERMNPGGDDDDEYEWRGGDMRRKRQKSASLFENKINKTDLQEIIKETIQEEKSFLLSAPKK